MRHLLPAATLLCVAPSWASAATQVADAPRLGGKIVNWPTDAEMAEFTPFAQDGRNVLKLYTQTTEDKLWSALPAPKGDLFTWTTGSTYLKRPPFFDGVTLEHLNAFLKRNPPGPFTIVTVGPKELDISGVH